MIYLYFYDGMLPENNGIRTIGGAHCAVFVWIHIRSGSVRNALPHQNLFNGMEKFALRNKIN